MQRPAMAFALAATVAALAAWASEGVTGPSPPPSPRAGSVDDRIDAFVESLPSWPSTVPIAKSTVAREPAFIEDRQRGDVIDYKCDVSGKNLVRQFTQLLAAGSNLEVLYPGALVEGASVRSGSPVLLPLARAPITIRLDLPISGQSKRVDNVNSVTMAQAVADLQTAAANEQGDRDPVRADMVFELSEASTFEQSMTAVGVALGYANPFKGVAVDANIDGSTTRSLRTHSVVVKFVQEMFTVHFADDLQPRPSDLFAPSVQVSDLEALRAAGKIAPSNLPLYVESVTYGRVLLFTLKSMNVATAQELKVAMQASIGAYKGGTSFTDERRKVLSNATYRFVVFGGPQNAATAAIASLDWSKFFVPARATTAVPIAFSVRTLKGRQPATIFDDVVYEDRGGCQEASSYTIDVTLKRVERTGAPCAYGGCYFAWDLRQTGQSERRVVLEGVIRDGAQEFHDARRVTINPRQWLQIGSIFRKGPTRSNTGRREYWPFRYPGEQGRNELNSLKNGVEVTRQMDVSVNGAAGRFTYLLKKTANFP